MIPDYEYGKLDARRRARLLGAALSLGALLLAANETAVAQSPPQAEASGQKAAPRPLPNLELIQELTRPRGTTSMTWSSDGSKLAAYTVAPGALSIDGKLITVWNADGQILREIEAPAFFFSSDAPLAFVAGAKQLVTTPWFKSFTLGFMIFDIESGKVVREVEGPFPTRGRPYNAASRIVASPDQSMLAVIFGALRSYPVTLYSTRDWSKVAALPEISSPGELAFSPDGKLLAVADLSGFVLVYDVVSTRPTDTYIKAFDDGGIQAMAFSPDGSLLAVAAGQAQGPKIVDPVRIFRIADGARVGSFPMPLDVIHCLAWSPKGHLLAFISGWGNEILHLWDPSQPESERRTDVTGYSASLAFSRDGARLALAHGNKIAMYRIAP